ncbi:universal stress protein [Ponticoccus gilvus]|nr:universal stress protein [Enemella evansiae]
MFKRIMVPVDLTHADRLDKALGCAADMAKQYGAEVVYVGVASASPSAIAHNPQEYAQKLKDFADAQATARGITAQAHAVTSHDPATDLDATLLKAIADTGSDLVVMASHVPNVTDYIWASNGGTIAGHAKISVMLVR